MSNNKQKREYKTLLQVLANGNPTGANALLKKYSGETAQNPRDLAIKLEKAYLLAPYKKDIEKEFAECHPHRNFILKYTEPKIIVKEVSTEPAIVKLPAPPVTSLVEETLSANGCYTHPPCGNPNCPRCNRYFSNANGGCGCSNCSGGYSNFSDEQKVQNNTSVIIFGFVSIIAIFGFVLTLKNSNK